MLEAVALSIIPGQLQGDGQPDHPQGSARRQYATFVIGHHLLCLAYLGFQTVDEGFSEVTDLIGDRLLKNFLSRGLFVEQHLAVGNKICNRVGQGGVAADDVVPQLVQHAHQAFLFRGSRGGEIGVDLVGDAGDVADECRVPASLLHLLHHAAGGQRQVAGGIAEDGIPRFEALNPFFLGVNGAQVGAGVVEQPAGQV